MRKNNAFSLTEIVVSLVILSVTMAGMTNLFFSAKRYVSHSRCRMQAANLARYCLDPLQMYVRQDQWVDADYDYVDSNLLKKTVAPRDLIHKWLGYPLIEFSPALEVSVPPGFDQARSPMRKVILRINWIEPVLPSLY